MSNSKYTNRELKNLLYEQVARLGKAISSPKRLELIEVLCQGPKTVDQLAVAASMSVKLTSAHLKELKAASVVIARREGRNIIYTITDKDVADLWVKLRSVAEARLVELQQTMKLLVTRPAELTPLSGEQLLRQAKDGDVVVLDVRPEDEFHAGHFPHARSIPLDELMQRLEELPKSRPVVAYCRGPFCLFATEAVSLLHEQGYKASRIELGVAEWRALGLPLASGS